MKKILAALLLLTAPLAAQTIAPSQIKPGTNGQVISTVGGKTAWANNSVSVTSVFGRTGAVVPVTGDYSCPQVTGAICSLPSIFYQTVQVDGVAQTQRATTNFINGSAGTVTCVDNPVTLATDCTFTGGSSAGITYSIANVSGSRSANVAYQNTTDGPMFIQGSIGTSGSSTGHILVAQGLTSGSLTFVGPEQSATATVSSGDAGFSATIMPGYWYMVQTSGAVNGGTHSWTQITSAGSGGGGGGGGGATFPSTPGVVWSTTTLASRNATFSDIVGLWTTCTSGFLKFDGTCANPTGSGTLTTISGVNANGFTWSIANPSSTPALTLGVDGTHFLPTNTGASSSYLGADAAYHVVPTSLPPSGSCGGDLSGTFPNCGVAKINGGAPPTSTAVAGYDSSGKPVAVPSQAADAVLAAPCGSGGVPGFRKLCSTDLPPGLLSMPAISTMLFDYLMPASDSALSVFKDYSTQEGSPVGVGDCPFTSGHTPTYLALGGASFDSNPYATYSACDVPSAANGLHTLVAMIAPAVLNNPTTTTIARNTLLGGSAGTPYFMAWSPSAPVGSGITVLGAGPRTESTDPTDGLTCAGYVINSAGTDALYINGNVVGSYAQTTGTPVLSTGHYLLGASFDATTVAANFFGNMYRAAGWSTLLTPGQIAQACGVLQEDAKSKGALNPALQQNSSLTPVVVNSGDSIALGTGGGTPPITLMTGLPTITTSVAAIGGGIVNDNTGQLLVKEIPACTTAAENYLISEGGSNDLAFGATAADTWTAQVRYAKLLRAAWNAKGCHGKIGVQTLLSRYGIDTGNANFIASTTVASGGSAYNTGTYTVTYTGTCTVTTPSGGFFTNVGGVINAVAFTVPGQGCTGTGISITGSPGTGASVSAVLSVAGSGTRDVYNALLRANALSSGFDFVADAAEDANLGKNNGFLNQTCFGGDWIHPLVFCEQAIANVYSNALLPQMNQAVQPVKVTASSYSILPGNTNILAAPTASQAFTMPDCTGQSGASYLLSNPQSSFAVTLVGLSAAQPINGLTSAITIPSNTQAVLTDTPVVANTGGCYWTMAYSPASGGSYTPPSGTGYAHVTSGVQDTAAKVIGTNDLTPPLYIAGAGSVNVMTATLSPAATSLLAGLELNVLPNLANTTTTPTLNVSGLGAKTITKCGTVALAAGDYSTTAVAEFVYDGTRMQLLNPQAVGCSSSTPAVHIANGTSALGVSAIASGACATTVTTTATGVASTDVLGWGFNGSTNAVTGYIATTNGMLTIKAYPSSGNVNFDVCNNTSASVTPGAITLNWSVIR